MTQSVYDFARRSRQHCGQLRELGCQADPCCASISGCYSSGCSPASCGVAPERGPTRRAGHRRRRRQGGAQRLACYELLRPERELALSAGSSAGTSTVVWNTPRGLECTGRCRPDAQTIKPMAVTATANTAHFKLGRVLAIWSQPPGVQESDRKTGWPRSSTCGGSRIVSRCARCVWCGCGVIRLGAG